MTNTNQSILNVLQADPLFARLSSAELAKLAGAAEIVSYAAGETVFSHGTVATACYLLLSGDVQVVSEDGTACVIEGRVFGEEAVNLESYITTANALSESTLFCINRNTLNALKGQSPGFATHASLILVERFSGTRLKLGKPSQPKAESVLSAKEKLGWLLTTLVPVLLYFLAESKGFTDYAAIFMAIGSAVVLMWAFSIVDEFVPPVIAVVACVFIGLAPTSVALSGFSTPSLLTLLGVYALAATVMKSGLSYRVVLLLLKTLPSSAFSNQLVLLLTGYLLSFVTPSGNNRISLLLPIYKDMASSLKLEKQGPAATGLMAATFGGAMLFSPMLAISKSANITAVTFLPDFIQEKFLGFYWLYAAFFCALGITLFHLIAVRRCFPIHNERVVDRQVVDTQLMCLGPMSLAEKVAAFGFAAFVLLCSTYSVHHVEPSVIAGLILVLFLLFGAFTKVDFKNQTDWPMIFFLLGIDSLMTIMAYLGLDQSLAASVQDLFGFVGGRLWVFILAACVTTLVIRLVLPLTAGMLVACVILLPVAEHQGIHPWLCIFLCAVFSDVWFFPYQSSVYLQVKSTVSQDVYSETGFMKYNMLANLGRVLVVFASIPWWMFLGLA